MSEAESSTSVVLWPGTDEERTVPLGDWLVVGRECQGIDDRRRVIIDDDTVSRHHLEIRLDPDEDRAVLVDLSTNGTKLNGIRVERAAPVPLTAGDRITVGPALLEFRSDRYAGSGATDRRRTSRAVTTTPMALVVGDIVAYSTVSEQTDSSVVLDALAELYDGLRRLLLAHGGTLVAYAGDAIFAAFDADPPAPGAGRAVAFARAARQHVRAVAPTLPMQGADGAPLRMGWAVHLGPVAVSTLTQAQPAVIGDTTNLAFRLSGLAARDGHADILLTDAVRHALATDAALDGPVEVRVKGRQGAVSIFGLTE